MTNLEQYAERELIIAGLIDKDSDDKGELAKAVMELIRVFAKQGHSELSANMIISIFTKLARFEPLTPLIGADDEWHKIDENTYQNKRYFRVFKSNGKAYDMGRKVFKDKNGRPYICCESKVPITFPYVPETEIVETRDREEGKQNG